ncbi:unnamed protein product [Clonostachys byssicola]|uniref:Uncharacterized protein n=1 Tax=Clonostachys byssicola TaxID=160290 RepID=A0A9N9U9B5_9HYPO|nr:unnamed protein product [Clonostachys byssicola]
MPPPMNNDAVAEFLGETLSKAQNLTVQPVQNTAVLGERGTLAGPFAMEYIFTPKTTDDGKLVLESWEFVDLLTATQTSKSGKE